MNPLDIIIDDKKYKYIDSITYKNKNYVIFSDDNYIYIKEYDLNNELNLYDIDDSLYEEIRKKLNL